jgi:hypothetical protein
MIIDDLNLAWTRLTLRPVKTNAPLIVDPNAELTAALAFQGLQTVAGQGREVSDADCGLQAIEFQSGPSLDSGEGLHAFATGEIPGPLVAVTEYHNFFLRMRYALRQA